MRNRIKGDINLKEGGTNMAVSNIKAILQYDIHKVWEVTTTVEQYTWRSDLGRTEVLSEKQFVADLEKALHDL